MSLNNIIFNLSNGNLGRVLPGSDYISGYVIFSNTYPSGFTASTALPIYSLQQAETLGIVGDYSDETKATATLLTTATGSSGDLIYLNITEPVFAGNQLTNTITYTRQNNDTTTTLLSAGIVNTINASGTGYTASNVGATISLYSRPGMGTSLNSGTPITITNANTATLTISSQFSGGAASSKAQWHYQISEFFRMQPNGVLWVGFYPTSDTTFASINTIQVQSGGALRQIMVQSTATSTSTMLSDLDLIQAQGTIMFNNYTPASILYSPNFYSISDLSTLPNIRSKSDNFVSVVIGQDANGLGGWISQNSGKSVTSLGAALGAVSLANVDEDIAWVSKFNISNGIEDETIGFINRQTWSSLYSTSKSLLVQLDAFGYIFLKKLNNISGSYFNDSHTACNITSDYAYIENNRTIDKAVRNLYLELAPLISSPILFNKNGTLSQITISNFENSTKPSLDNMLANGEISAYKITVDPNQNVQSTSTIKLNISIVGVGVARNITVNIGYALSV